MSRCRDTARKALRENVTSAALHEVDFAYATSLAQRVVRLMAEQRVPPTPSNFHVWFNYSIGAASDLKRAIDILIGNKRPFDAVANRELFANLVRSQAPDLGAVSNASQQLHSVMAAARQFLTTAIADNRSQMQAIDDVAGQRKAGLDPRPLVESSMHELARVAARAIKLEAGFVEKTRELDAIRDSLNKSEQRAKTDTLTGLPNRRALDEFFRPNPRAFGRANRSRSPS